ncbi:IPT/TIG domain-containing protein [Hymenobacter sp. DH14]|uniref:IPT/TIG domain-containing protein n=1 Tax=Hymenobacter cyanobacteriorum TaxID=2926463 RepID=A0A9X1VFH3_9BACT|nr:T9SS type A sorting domain-containing protein [Hymenobacter cyanobacteriorum]MCI1187128.1 IPT/TIG domain-containing protein [Hymenobacter cyanobacteriorum]
MNNFFASRGRQLLALLLLLLPVFGHAQNLTQGGFTGVLVPQYASSGTATRLPVMYRATVSGLTANTLYRYYTQAALSTDLGTTATGAGNPLLITPGTTPATTTYAYTSSASLSVAGGYATFTTNAAGSYTGWFGYVNTGNVRFTAGNVLYMSIVLATDALPATVEKRLALDQTLTVLALGTGTTATDATGLRGSSAATPKNLVAVYDNQAGTGRPLGLTVVEAINPTGSALTGVPAYYTTNAGDWNTLIPNVLTTGVRRVEQRSVVDASIVGCASDADGVWPSGANTVNPTGGTTAVALTATDAPLNTSACGSASTAAITVTPATLIAFNTTVGTPSATQTLTVGGTGLTTGIVVTAPAGYEVSLNATSGFGVLVTVPQTAGTAAATPVYVRLTGTTAGSFAGNVALTSTGAATLNVAVTGTVTAVVVSPPTITSFTPTSGGPGTPVTITGTNLMGATAVRIGSFAVANFTVVNANAITLTVPTGTGSVNGLISVTTPGGTATSTTPFNLASATAAATALPGLAVFPNPATDRLTVALPTAAPATVALRDLAGRLVLAPTALAADHQLRLPAGLARGVYFLEVHQNGTQAVRRIEQR